MEPSMQLFFEGNEGRQTWRSVFSSRSPLVVILPRDHRLAAFKAISPGDLAGETFVTVSDTAPVLRVVIDNYLKQSGINITPDHEADHLAMGMSLIASTRGVGLLPAYAQNFLPRFRNE